MRCHLISVYHGTMLALLIQPFIILLKCDKSIHVCVVLGLLTILPFVNNKSVSRKTLQKRLRSPIPYCLRFVIKKFNASNLSSLAGFKACVEGLGLSR